MAVQTTLRAAAQGERAGVVRLVLDSYAEFEPFLASSNWAQMRANLAAVPSSGEGDLLIAEVGDEVVGTVTYLAPGPRSYDRVPFDWALIRVLAVLPAYRGQGIGRMLTRECLRRAQQDGAATVGLHTAELFTAARAMYEQMGFTAQRAFTHLGITFWIYALHL
ncbi:MAG: GNAT family N-acetyltransferase [Egibacteraceae bacterium]